jgi:hypothetical protein
MDESRVVEFVIRLADLRKAAKQLFFNRGGFADTDCADLLISPCVATFRAVGTEVEVPVHGMNGGPVRIPLRALKEIVQLAPSFRKTELTLYFEAGRYRLENSFVRTHPDITLGIFPDQKFDLPPDAGPLDTLALASLLSPEQIADQGMRERVEDAQKHATQAISRAVNSLREFGIERKRIQELVDGRIANAAEGLASVLQHPR